MSNQATVAQPATAANPNLPSRGGNAGMLLLMPPPIQSVAPVPPIGPNGNPELPFHKAGRDFHNPNVEAALLSACLNSRKHVSAAAQSLGTEDIHNPDNHAVFRAILDLHGRGLPITPPSVITHLKAMSSVVPADPITHVNLCAAASFNPTHIEKYIKDLKHATAVRGGDGYAAFKFSESFCAELLRLRLPPFKCVADKWYVYGEGEWKRTEKSVYRPKAMDAIHPFQQDQRRCLGVLDHVESESQVSEGIFSGAYKADGESILINVNNGTLVVRPDVGVKLRPHDPADHFTLKIPTNFDLAAQCPLFERTLAECLPDSEDQLLLQAFAGYSFLPHCDHEASLVCFGEGRTGKSTLAGTFLHVLGKGLCGSCGLEELCKSGSYSLPSLKSKMLNLGAELDGTEIETSANFKKLVSGEHLNAREIYGKPEEMQTSCKFLFLTNHMPRFRAGSNAEERRLRLLHFDRIVEAEDPKLKDKLRAEVSGVLNWMLVGMLWLLRNNYVPDGGPKSRELANEFHRTNDYVKAYVKECCILDPNGFIRKRELFSDFDEWCGVHGIPGKKLENTFFKGIKKRFDLKSERRKFGSAREYVFIGIDFKP